MGAGAGRTIAGLLLPRSCVGCGTALTWWCESCAAAVRLDPQVRQLPGTELLVAAAVPYENPARRAILAHKDRQVTALRPVLASWLHTALRVHPAARVGTVLVPVPPTRRARLRRGRDPVAEVVAPVVAAGGAVGATQPLRWLGRPRPQKELDRSQRAANVLDRLQARTAPEAPLLIVDDVTTTGATLAEAERALRRSGAAVVGAVAMCYTR